MEIFPSELDCTYCLNTLPLSCFAKHSKSKRQYQYICKSCYSIKHKEYRQKPGFKEHRLVYQQKWSKENPDIMRSWQLKQYGITQQDYDLLLEKQNYSCKICNIHLDKTPQKETRKMKYRLHVDHCHATGKVRGLLCTNCNTGLGQFKDDITLLQKSINYLKESRGD